MHKTGSMNLLLPFVLVLMFVPDAYTQRTNKPPDAYEQLRNYRYDSLPIKPPEASREADYITNSGPLPSNGVLAYEPISEDDVAYRQRVWRDIDVREKINQPFAYDAEEDNGKQQFIYVLLNAIRNDPAVVAYNTIDDRFTKPLTRKELGMMLSEAYVEPVPNRADSGRTWIDTLLVRDFDPASVTCYRLKEDWVFDKKTSRLVVRIIGIAPMQLDSTSIPGEVIEKPMFWLYYPKLRNALANSYVYNARNHGARPTWEQVFESRMFNSYIVKSTMDNPGDLFLKDQAAFRNNNLLRLKEGERIGNAIRDYEQNLWSY